MRIAIHEDEIPPIKIEMSSELVIETSSDDEIALAAYSLRAIADRLDRWAQSGKAKPLTTADCACYCDCGDDSYSGGWHQHSDEPCSVHPERGTA